MHGGLGTWVIGHRLSLSEMLFATLQKHFFIDGPAAIDLGGPPKSNYIQNHTWI
jgi:hypothetical protein